MKYKKIVIILSIIGILFIVGGCILSIVKLVNDTKKDSFEQENLIISNYDNFRNRVEKFNTARTNYSNNVVSNMFLELIDDYSHWIDEIDIYTKAIDNVEASSLFLKEACIEHFYKKEDIKNKCDAFIIAYETAINYYTKDIVSFNEKIDSYNEESNKELEKYNLKYEYTDINSDGKFYGKD